MPATDFSMTLHLKPTTISEDVSIHHAQGRIFARIWTPSTDKRQSPIVLFHDSVGCVELWRGFPAALSAGTERRVIAYDRRSTKGQKEILNESLLFHEGLHGYSGKEDGDLIQRIGSFFEHYLLHKAQSVWWKSALSKRCA
jgi:pimeloyl-ACP methyl ester carboxylesterase